MEIVEIIDQRFSPDLVRNHLLDSNDYFYIKVMKEDCSGLLVWPGGDIKIQRSVSNKRLSRLKIRSLVKSSTPIRDVRQSPFLGNTFSVLFLDVTNLEWILSYNGDLINHRFVGELLNYLRRLKI